jgi:nuclear transcription factor Y gamma
MKADEDVRMISAEAPVLFAKACEMFILELTLRSWIHTEENKRRTLQKNDIAAAITRTDIFDFLVDIVPRDELNKEDGLGVSRGAMPVGSPVSYEGVYYVQTSQGVLPQAAMGSPALMGNSMMVARPAMSIDPTLYQPQRPPMQYLPQHAPMQQMWQQPPSQLPPNQQPGMPPNN